MAQGVNKWLHFTITDGGEVWLVKSQAVATGFYSALYPHGRVENLVMKAAETPFSDSPQQRRLWCICATAEHVVS